MTMDTTSRASEAAPASATEALGEVYQRLVGIYASVAESLSTDPEVVPWVEGELKDLLRFIRESGAAPPVSRARPG